MKPIILLALLFLSGCGIMPQNGTTPDLYAYNANLTNPPPPILADADTAWLGDSYVALGAWSAWFPGSLNWGHGGDTTAAILARIPASVPATVYVWCGANDLIQGIDRSVTTANYSAIIDLLRANGAQRIVCLSVMPFAPIYPDVFYVGYAPSLTDTLDDQLKAVALAHGAEWIDLRPAIVDSQGWCIMSYSAPAGIHLSALGYERILALLRPAG